MEIRRATMTDLSRILEIYECARQYMRESGNSTQWGNSYPPVSLVQEDIRQERCYIISDSGEIHGVFVFFIGEDPTYFNIEGSWLNDKPYGVVHRIGSDGTVSGMFRALSDFCKNQISDIRIDTHKNNHTMQHLLAKHGFKKCGVIFLEDGQPRLAYHFTTPGVCPLS